MLRALVLAAVLAGSGVWQGTTPAPAPEPTYDAKFTDADGQVYTGSLTFLVDAKGVVTGKMKLTDPITVVGTMAGTVKGGKWTFEFPYEIPEQSCSGVVKGTADITTDSKTIQGTGTAAGCSEAPIQLTFTFMKK